MCLVVSFVRLKRFSLIWNHFISYTDRSGLEDAMDKQVSKSKLLVCYIAQFVESLRRNRWGPGSMHWTTKNIFERIQCQSSSSYITFRVVRLGLLYTQSDITRSDFWYSIPYFEYFFVILAYSSKTYSILRVFFKCQNCMWLKQIKKKHSLR